MLVQRDGGRITTVVCDESVWNVFAFKHPGMNIVCVLRNRGVVEDLIDGQSSYSEVVMVTLREFQ